MQHYLHLCKQELGRRILMLVLLVVYFCSGARAWTREYTAYYTPDGKQVTADTKRALKFTLVYDSENSDINRMITACEPVNERDFEVIDDDYVDEDVYKKVPFEITEINLYIGYENEAKPTVLPTIGIADGVFSTEFWQDALKGIKLPYKTRYLGKNFVGKNSHLDYVDFSGCDNLGKIIFDEEAFGTDYNYNGRHTIFKDGVVTYSICNGHMEVKNISNMLERMVLLGSKTIGNITGYLTSLGGLFKGYTTKEFSLAITDGMEGLEDGALQGSSLVAVSLPRSFDLLNSDGSDNAGVTCGSDVFTDCDKLKRIYVFHGGVPYCFIKNSDTNKFYGGYDTDCGDSNYQFVYSDLDVHEGLTNDLFAARLAQTKGRICIVPSVTYATGCTVDMSQNKLERYFSGNTAITSVKIINRKDGCSISQGLDNNCFKGCTGLTDVDIEVAAENKGFSLGGGCFKNCTSLKNVKLGKYVGNLSGCFDGCTALKNVEFEKDADCELYINDCFNGCTALTTLDLRDRKIVGFEESSIGNSSGINTIYLNKNNGDEQQTYAWTTANSINLLSGKYNGTTTCDDMADGEKVVLLGVTNASDKFDLSSTNGKVSFTDSKDREIVSGNLARVLDGTLTGYTYVELPYGVDFGNNCFDRTKLTHLGLYPTQGVHVTPTYPKEDMATASGKNFFFTVDRCDADVENIVIPSEVVASNVDGVVMFVGDDTNKIPVLAKKSLWGNAENTTLKSVTFAKSSTVGDYVLNIKSNYVPTICAYAFSNCKNLATVKFPTYAFDVEWYAFNDCASLTSVDLRHCRKLSYNAFYNCPSIGTVRFGDQLVEMKDDIFSGDEGKRNTTLKSIVMPQFTLFGDGAWTPSYSAKAFSNLANVKTVVIDPDVSAKNCVSSFDGWKTTLGVLKDNGLKVYVTSAAYDKLKTDASNFEDYDVKAAGDYRLMATTTADGEALDKGYGTICLEKAASLDECYNVKAIYTASYNEDKNAVVLGAVTTPEAGEPYVYARGNDDPSGLVVFGYGADDTTVDAPLTGSPLVGTFKRIYAPKGSYVLQSDNQFHIVGSDDQIGLGAYRAYLSAPASGDSEARLSIIEDGGDQPTGINGVEENTSNDDNAPMYNLNGQRIAAPVKGQIYIIKGKKIVKK